MANAMGQDKFRLPHHENRLTDFDEYRNLKISLEGHPLYKIWLWIHDVSGLGEYSLCHIRFLSLSFSFWLIRHTHRSHRWTDFNEQQLRWAIVPEQWAEKQGAAVPPSVGPHLTQRRLGQGLPPYQVVSWSIQPFGYNRYGRQLGVCPFWGRGAGSPSNIMWPEPKPTSIPSGILIHATIWPQYTNVTDRTDRQRSESDSIRWTVLQTVAPKLAHYENYRIDSSRIL